MPDSVTTLYSGDDLQHASERSTLRADEALSAWIRNPCAAVLDIARRRARPGDGPPLQATLALGPPAADSAPLTVLYVGRGPTRHDCLARTLTGWRVVEERVVDDPRLLTATIAELVLQADIGFAEGIDLQAVEGLPRQTIATPAWIKQHVSILPDWQEQLRQLKRSTRREVSRYLRKYGYRCRVVTDSTGHEQLYDTMYRPHIQRRFGDGAQLVDRDKFLLECRHATVLQLVREGVPLGGVVLRRRGNVMIANWPGLDERSAVNPGVNDCLDYFSILAAHLLGCRALDLGASRADLNDGVLRYKAKWGARLTAGFAPQTDIHWWYRDTGPRVMQALRRRIPLTRIDAGFAALLFVQPEESTADGLVRRLKGCEFPGVAEVWLVANEPLSAAVLDTLPGIRQAASLPSRAKIKGLRAVVVPGPVGRG
jgi:hypothetical protein